MDEIVRAAQRGDPAAMDALLRALTPYVSRVCGSIALDRGDDAMQETFIVLLRRITTLREPAALHGWVRRIAVRESIRVARGRTVPAEITEHDLPPVPPLDVATALDVRATLATLVPEQRAVLVLRDLDGLSESDVARTLGVAEGTVKSRLHRARTRFAQRWRT